MLYVAGRMHGELGEGKGNRAIYTRVGHEHPFVMANLFDAPSTGTIHPKREESTTATQSLFMLNDPMVIDASKRLHRLVMSESDDVKRQIEIVYEMLFTRKPSIEEIEVGQTYLKEQSKDNQWTYFHVLFCSNEFLYLE